MACNEFRLAAGLGFFVRQHGLKPNSFVEVEDMIKSQIARRQAEQKLIANKKMRNYSSASLAANPMLAAVYCRGEDLCFDYFSISLRIRQQVILEIFSQCQIMKMSVSKTQLLTRSGLGFQLTLVSESVF
jgi:hypothetical protein